MYFHRFNDLGQCCAGVSVFINRASHPIAGYSDASCAPLVQLGEQRCLWPCSWGSRIFVHVWFLNHLDRGWGAQQVRQCFDACGKPIQPMFRVHRYSHRLGGIAIANGKGVGRRDQPPRSLAA